MDVFDMQATLKLNTREYEKGMRSAKEGASGFGATMKGVFAGNLAYDAFKKLGGAALDFGKDSLQAGMDFDSAMSQVAATSGMTMEELTKEVGHAETAFGSFNGNLREFAQFMGANTAFSATQAAEALNYMALAGYKTQESMAMLPNVLNLAAAGSMDLAKASDMVTDTQTAFGLKMEEMPRLVDEMAKAASTGNTSVEQLGDAFLTVGGLAQELNGGMVKLADGTSAPVNGIQEMEIALTAMANAGIKGSEAGTHMRNMLLKLSSPTSDGAKQMEALGVSVFDTEGNMRSLSDIFGELNDSMSTLTQEEKIQAIADLFNTRDLASAEALLNAVGDDWNYIGSQILDAEGAAAQMAATQLDNLAGDVTLFKSAMEGLQIAISDSGTGPLRQFVQIGTEGLNALTSFMNGEGLSSFETFAQKGAEMFQSFALGAVEAIPQIITGIGESLPQFLEKGTEIAGNIADGIIAGVPQIITGISTTIQGILLWLANSLPTFLQKGVEFIESMAAGVDAEGGGLINTIIEVAGKVLNSLIEYAPKLLVAGIKFVVAIAKGIIKNLPTLIKTAINMIPKILSGLLEAAKALLKAGWEIITQILSGVKEKKDELWNWIKDKFANIPQLIKDAIGNLFNVGKDIINGLWDGIRNAWESVKNWFKGKVGSLEDDARAELDSHSPSRVFIKVGRTIPQGLAAGIEDEFDTVDKAMSELEDLTFNGRDFDMGTVDGTLEEVLSLSFGDAMTGMMERLVPNMADILTAAMENVKVTMNSREFGRMTRKAVGGAI